MGKTPDTLYQIQLLTTMEALIPIENCLGIKVRGSTPCVGGRRLEACSVCDLISGTARLVRLHSLATTLTTFDSCEQPDSGNVSNGPVLREGRIRCLYCIGKDWVILLRQLSMVVIFLPCWEKEV